MSRAANSFGRIVVDGPAGDGHGADTEAGARPGRRWPPSGSPPRVTARLPIRPR